MNLRDSKSGLLAIAALLFFFSCDEPGEIGIGIDPENSNLKAVYVEIPLKITQVKAPPFIVLDSTDAIGPFLIGAENNPLFGTSSAKSFTQIVPRDTTFRANESFVLDSVTVTMTFDYIYGAGASTSVQKIAIHELTENIDISTNRYFSNDAVAYNPEPLGEVSFMPNTEQYDTANSFSARLRLDDELGHRFIDEAKKANGGVFSQRTGFSSFFNGLAFVPGEDNNCMMRISPPVSNLTLHYHTNTDTSSYILLYRNAISFYNIERDFQDSPLSPLTAENEYVELDDELFYVKSGVGTLARVSFSPVKDYFDTIPNKIITNAVFEIETEPFDKYLEPPFRLDVFSLAGNYNLNLLSRSSNLVNFINSYSMYFTPNPIDEDDPGAPRFGIYQVRNRQAQQNQNAPQDITSSIQSLLGGNNSLLDWIIVPTSYGFSSDQFVAQKSNIKLKIYYTTLRE
ncbi:MAG: DUF4270 family protein [Cyclobacteriaceae bacterium]